MGPARECITGTVNSTKGACTQKAASNQTINHQHQHCTKLETSQQNTGPPSRLRRQEENEPAVSCCGRTLSAQAQQPGTAANRQNTHREQRGYQSHLKHSTNRTAGPKGPAAWLRTCCYQSEVRRESLDGCASCHAPATVVVLWTMNVLIREYAKLAGHLSTNNDLVDGLQEANNSRTGARGKQSSTEWV